VAALAGVDLQRRCAGGADAVGVVAGLLVAFDHRHRHAAGQHWMVRTSRLVLPEPGLETRFSANTPRCASSGAVARGVAVVLGQDVALDLHHAGLAHARHRCAGGPVP
jgi:hypothetical protein